jgi:hypothetical protein
MVAFPTARNIADKLTLQETRSMKRTAAVLLGVTVAL